MGASLYARSAPSVGPPRYGQPLPLGNDHPYSARSGVPGLPPRQIAPRSDANRLLEWFAIEELGDGLELENNEPLFGQLERLQLRHFYLEIELENGGVGDLIAS